MSTNPPAYVRVPEGFRFRDAQGALGLVLVEDLALMNYRDTGEVLKPGGAGAVQEAARRMSDALRGTTLAPDVQVLVIPLDRLTPELLEEANRALWGEGDVADLARRLAPGTWQDPEETIG